MLDQRTKAEPSPKGRTSRVLSHLRGSWDSFLSKLIVFSRLDGKSMRLDCFYSRLYQCSALNRQQFYTFF